jgi:hypothetical protein
MIAAALKVGWLMGRPLNTPHVEPTRLGAVRTLLGERLAQIREKIVASGEPLLSWEEIEREVAERRGERDHQSR